MLPSVFFPWFVVPWALPYSYLTILALECPAVLTPCGELTQGWVKAVMALLWASSISERHQRKNKCFFSILGFHLYIFLANIYVSFSHSEKQIIIFIEDCFTKPALYSVWITLNMFIFYMPLDIFLILIIFTLSLLHISPPLLFLLIHILVKISMWKLKIILLYTKKEIENEKYFTSLQNSQVFIYPIVCFSFFPHDIVCLNNEKEAFYGHRGKGE